MPQALKIPLTIGVTGHRNLRDEDVAPVEQATRRWLAGFQRSHPDCPLRLIAPLAEGADRIVARVALELGMELIVLTPFELAEYERDFPDRASRSDFRALLDQGATLIELPLIDGHGPEDLEDPETRALHYARMGVFLSDHAQILIAVWDGEDSDLVGGTAQVVRYHQLGAMTGGDGRFSRPVDILAEDSTDLVVHVACARRDSAGPRRWPAGTVRMLVASPEPHRVDRLPPNYAAMIERIGTFNVDLRTLEPVVEPELPGWEEARAHRPGDPLLHRTVDLFAAADRLASRFRLRFTQAMRASFVLAGLMGLAFIAYADLDQGYALAAFLLAYGGAFGIYALAQRFQWHRRYLDYRILAEGLRVQFYWRASGISGRQRNDYAHDSFLLKQDLEVSWIRQVMKAVELPGSVPPPVTLPLDRMIGHWLGDEHSGQIGYFSARVVQLGRRARLTRHIIAGCVFAGIALGLVLLLGRGSHVASVENVLVAAMGLLPLVAGLREAYAQKTAQSELARQYRYMLRLFTDAQRKLADADEAGQRAVLRALGEAALDEHAQWMLLHRERALDRYQL